MFFLNKVAVHHIVHCIVIQEALMPSWLLCLYVYCLWHMLLHINCTVGVLVCFAPLLNILNMGRNSWTWWWTPAVRCSLCLANLSGDTVYLIIPTSVYPSAAQMQFYVTVRPANLLHGSTYSMCHLKGIGDTEFNVFTVCVAWTLVFGRPAWLVTHAVHNTELSWRCNWAA